jgi:hypothetical protein
MKPDARKKYFCSIWLCCHSPRGFTDYRACILGLQSYWCCDVGTWSVINSVSIVGFPLLSRPRETAAFRCLSTTPCQRPPRRATLKPCALMKWSFSGVSLCGADAQEQITHLMIRLYSHRRLLTGDIITEFICTSRCLCISLLILSLA